MGLSSNPSIKTWLTYPISSLPPMSTSKLRDLKSIDDVARACGIEVEFIQGYAESKEQHRYYDALKISKRERDGVENSESFSLLARSA